MRRITSARLVSCALAMGALGVTAPAAASNGFEFSEAGAEQFGRGGAWVARASDPLATLYNPAALATQASGVSLDVHVIFNKVCFARQNPDGSAAVVTLGATGDAKYPTDSTCNTNSGSPFPNPTLAVTYRATDKLGLGFYFGGPTMPGKTTYPETSDGIQNNKTWTVPSTTRYLLVQQDGLILAPTLGAGYSVLDNLQVGAAFTWGMAPKLQFQNVATALDGSKRGIKDDAQNDVKATLDAKDMFIPAVSIGALWAPSSNLDVGFNWRWSDDLKAKGEAHIEGPYYKNGKVQDAATYCDPAGQRGSCVDTPKGLTDLRIPQPMQARVGVRFHQPRAKAAHDPAAGEVAQVATRRVRDPLADDQFDIELDLTWANNSRVDSLEIRFNADPVTRLPYFAEGQVPKNADVPHEWKDVVGVRLGGDYVFIPNRVAARAGAWFETRGQDPAYANIDFVPAQRFGLTLGGTVRVIDNFDIVVAGGHVFGSKLDNGGNGDVPALAGSGSSSYTSSKTGKATAFRTANAVNGGWTQQSITVLSLGLNYRF